MSVRSGFRASILAMVALCVVLLVAVRPGPVSSQEPPAAGSEVEVSGAGDCLNVRSFWGKDAPVLACLPDGTRARTAHGRAVVDDGETWWELAGMGWTASRYLRVVGPPIPSLMASSAPRPFLPGLLAFVGDDWNVWLARPDGTGTRQVTTDAVPSGSAFVGYMNLAWSPDGRYLAFRRTGATSSILLFDAATTETRTLEPGEGRVYSSNPYWLPDGALAVAFVLPATLRGSPGDLYREVDGGIEVVNVATNARRDVLSWGAERKVQIFELGPASPDGSRLAFDTGAYEFIGPACSVHLVTSLSHCTPEDGWTPRGWLSDGELVVRHNTYGVSNPFRNMVLATDSGLTRDASPADLESYQAPIKYSQATGEVRFSVGRTFEVPVQQDVNVWTKQAVSPSGSFFVFNVDRASWVGRSDGSGETWILPPMAPGVRPGTMAWQPAVLPPLLLVHGCGGGLATWTDTGWFADAVEVGQPQYGASTGRVHRGDWTRFHGSSVYAIDYNGSPGTLAELSSLIPAALDLVRSENGDTPVFIATHSMGGVLTQFYLADLASSGPYRDDIAGAYLVAPPTRGAWAANWSPDGWVCPQSGALEVGSDELRQLESHPPTGAPITITSGTAIWIPFVGDTDGIVAYDDIAPLGVDVPLLREDNGIHVDLQVLPNFLTALCETIPPTREPQQQCVNELRIESVVAAMLQAYVEALER